MKATPKVIIDATFLASLRSFHRQLWQRAGRPQKKDDWFVHRIADLFRYSEQPFWSLPERFHERYPSITSQRDIQCFIGKVLCTLNPKYRGWVLRQLADALEGKSEKKRKSGKADEIEKTRKAWRKAQAKLRGLYKGDNPTWREADTEYFKLTGFHLDRRALKDAGCPVRPDKPGRPKKLPRR
jgi:hypothetical protein